MVDVNHYIKLKRTSVFLVEKIEPWLIETCIHSKTKKDQEDRYVENNHSKTLKWRPLNEIYIYQGFLSYPPWTQGFAVTRYHRRESPPLQMIDPPFILLRKIDLKQPSYYISTFYWSYINIYRSEYMIHDQVVIDFEDANNKYVSKFKISMCDVQQMHALQPYILNCTVHG